MAHQHQPFLSPSAIAEQGQKIYDTRYRAEMEEHQRGRYLAINVRTEQATAGDTPEQALEEARRADPSGLFHLIRIGFPSVYSSSAMTSHAESCQDWIFGR
jgi:hypothetical protein